MKGKGFVKIGVVVLLAATAVLFWQYSWSTLPYYLPDDSEALPARFRTMAEHDEFMADKAWPYIVRFDTGRRPSDNSALLYYGSWHTNDPDDRRRSAPKARQSTRTRREPP